MNKPNIKYILLINTIDYQRLIAMNTDDNVFRTSRIESQIIMRQAKVRIFALVSEMQLKVMYNGINNQRRHCMHTGYI
jgi:hypothetical protein